jgi:hypothetical protein
MKWSRKLRSVGRAPEGVVCGASAVVDLNDLVEASHEGRVKALLRDAETEGARVSREGRKRW